MTHFTYHLTKLTCAAGKARDLGYVHTVHALERMIEKEKARLKAEIRPRGSVAQLTARESKTPHEA